MCVLSVSQVSMSQVSMCPFDVVYTFMTFCQTWDQLINWWFWPDLMRLSVPCAPLWLPNHTGCICPLGGMEDAP